MSESIERERNESAEDPRHLLGTTGDGAKVFDRIDGSHFHEEGGFTLDMLNAALSTIDTRGWRRVTEQVDFGHVIGKTTCVELEPGDDVVMVFRNGRNGCTPMVKNREAQPCSSVTVALARDESLTEDGNSYVLLTAYIGSHAPREPWDHGIRRDDELQECKEFWDTHALVYDESLIDLGRTEAFANMSEEERKKELLRQKTSYSGFFINDQAYLYLPKRLSREVRYPYVGIMNQFPDAEHLLAEQLGSEAKIIATDYGCNNRVERLKVRIETDNQALQQVCNELSDSLHITMSYANGVRAEAEKDPEYKPLKKPIELSGTYGLFVQGRTMTYKPWLSDNE